MADIYLEITFWRDVYSGPACLEYSWVPEGHRRTILLKPGEQVKSNNDLVASDLHPSHVQVYVLTNDRHSTEDWQFPPGPPHPTPVVSARIDVVEREMYAGGTVSYADGSKSTPPQRQKLDRLARKCPTGLSD
jgi:hypothetical protein